MRGLVYIAIVTELLASSATALADDDMKDLPQQVRDQAMKLGAEAREHFLVGYRAFSGKNYKLASAEFELAYKLSSEVPLLFTWAQSERLGGKCPHAVELYEKYLYSDINAEQAEYTRRWIKACGGRAEHKPDGGTTDGGTSGATGGGTSGTTGGGATGSGTGRDDGHVDHSPGGYVFYTDYLGDGLVASGAIGLVVGAVFLAHAHRDADASDSTKHPGLQLDQYKQLVASAKHEQNVATFATIVGGVLAAAGVGVYIYHWKTHEHVTVTTDGTSVSVATTF